MFHPGQPFEDLVQPDLMLQTRATHCKMEPFAKRNPKKVAFSMNISPWYLDRIDVGVPLDHRMPQVSAGNVRLKIHFAHRQVGSLVGLCHLREVTNGRWKQGMNTPNGHAKGPIDWLLCFPVKAKSGSVRGNEHEIVQLLTTFQCNICSVCTLGDDNTWNSGFQRNL